jgi:hypothetical protein
MIILNNCTDCGRVPNLIGRFQSSHFHAECKCGKRVESASGLQWSREVAADMWNRANPEEDGFEFNPEYINFLAGELARYRLRVIVVGKGLTIHETLDADQETCGEIQDLLKQCNLHTQDLAEFYRKRLVPAAR